VVGPFDEILGPEGDDLAHRRIGLTGLQIQIISSFFSAYVTPARRIPRNISI